MSPESNTGPVEITIQPRFKKPPACDYCRTRRVLCHPQPEGRSCPRCLEKGVKCTTTPSSVRKKRRRQREILAAKKEDDAGTSQGQELVASRALTVTTSAAQYAPRITHMLATGADLNDVYRRPIAFAPSSARPQLQLPKRLMEDLFNDFFYTPCRIHPIIPYDRVRARLAGCGWRPSSLSPQECVLVHCIFALASTRTPEVAPTTFNLSNTTLPSLHLLHDVYNALHKQGVLLARQNQSQNFAITGTVRMVSIGWTNLTLHFYKTMKEMLEESSVTDLYYTTTSGGPWHGHGIDIIDGLDGLERGTYSYSSSLAELELTPIFLAVRTLTCKAAIDHSEMIEDIYSISEIDANENL
ncbi:hypothetical protein D9758_018791 [Tetrapyrgos nigripes]|uniref:Zn(2)-C6 fungal-type domain-containing protein n=1 Tax=Tetrapyrgos nigripes TaxID=182062 RepID=A0A8H5B7A2_9AGAR|nr:hypothetical protein D9758_018791 [Tetrapyrgos nigripes]